jgi:hypothetical protein
VRKGSAFDAQRGIQIGRARFSDSHDAHEFL